MRVVERRVVSLAGLDRREQFLAQPGSAGFQVWEAFDGRTGAGMELFDGDAYTARTGKQIKPGEVGCAISHWRLNRWFADEPGADDDVMLVAEDDAVFTPDTLPVVEQLAARGGFDWAVLANGFEPAGVSEFWSKNRDRVALSWAARPAGPPGRRWAYRAGRYEGELWCTGLYMVTRSASRRLVQHAGSRLEWRADDYEAWHRAAGLDVHMVRPGLVEWRGESVIHPGGRAHDTEVAYSASRWGRQAWRRRARRARMSARATARSLTRS